MGSPTQTAPTPYPTQVAPTDFPTITPPTMNPTDTPPTMNPTDTPPTAFPTQTAPTPFPTETPPTSYPTAFVCKVKGEACNVGAIAVRRNARREHARNSHMGILSIIMKGSKCYNLIVFVLVYWFF